MTLILSPLISSTPELESVPSDSDSIFAAELAEDCAVDYAVGCAGSAGAGAADEDCVLFALVCDFAFALRRMGQSCSVCHRPPQKAHIATFKPGGVISLKVRLHRPVLPNSMHNGKLVPCSIHSLSILSSLTLGYGWELVMAPLVRCFANSGIPLRHAFVCSASSCLRQSVVL